MCSARQVVQSLAMQPGDRQVRPTGIQPGDPLICAVGADEHAERLVGCARRLSAVTGLRPLFAHVLEPHGDARTPRADSVWEARSLLRHAGARTTEMRVTAGDPASKLIEIAVAERAALLMVASRGFGRLKAAFLGSVSQRLMQSAPVPVMVLPPRADPTFDGRRVLCGIEREHEAPAITRVGQSLARVLDGEVAVATFPRGNAAEHVDALASETSAELVVIACPAPGEMADLLAETVSSGLAQRARQAVVVVPVVNGRSHA